MYNVIIVDDEPIIRFGLKSSINWGDEGLCLLGDYSNGEQALKAIENENQVDILITDIKMPVMDGITLMKKALNLFPKLKIILVSSYNDFDFVREGLKHGAVDYVLKATLEPEAFLQTIKRCVEKIDEEKAFEQKIDLAEQTSSIKERKVVEQEIKRILLSEKEVKVDEPIFADLQGPFIVVFIKMKNIDKVEEEFGYLYQSLIFEEIQERFYRVNKEGTLFPIGETGMIHFNKKPADPYDYLLKLKQQIEANTKIQFYFGFDITSDLTGTEVAFHNSLLACQNHFFNTKEDIFKFEKAAAKPIAKLKASKIKEFLLPYDDQRVKSFLENRQAEWATGQLSSDHIKKEACDILTNLFMNKMEISILLEKCTALKLTDSLEELSTMLMAEIKECDQYIKNQIDMSFTDNKLMEKALLYIHDHYTQEVTLQDVADHIHISRNYFSILFKRLVNQNFIDYVIHLRIKKAKALLSHSSLRVYEVAAESGFNDVKYFSKLFKKLTGMSPGDFRIQRQN
jgi:two-component system, response regulator YesN